MRLKPWTIVSSHVDKSYRVFNLRRDRARSPRTEETHDFYVLESPSWVNIIPLTSAGEVVLIRQYRFGIRDMTLEIPGGLVEPTDSPEHAARRELREETGYRESKLISLGTVHPNPAIQNNICHTFLASDVFHEGELIQDEREDIEVVLRQLSDIPRLIREGTISHALVVAAFYRFYMEFNGDIKS
ncbi:MAG TPA: NUDIX hydrolase [Syntrophales bacterium]|nr:NUDIX hydrolase [Syntrophales bacterium]